MADVTKQLAVQGVLKNSAGVALSGSRQITFAIYDVQTGGTPLTSNNIQKTVIADMNGLFYTLLNATDLSGLNFDTNYWLNITVVGSGGLPTQSMDQRQLLTPAPYALALPGLVSKDGKIGIGTTDPGLNLHVKASANPHAKVLIESKPGGEASLYLLRGDSSSLASIALSTVVSGQPQPTWFMGLAPNTQNLNFYQIAGEEILTLTPEGNVGIGTASPGAKLEVNGSLIVNSGHAVTDANPDANVIASFINTGAPLSSGETRVFDITQTSSNNVMLRGVGRNIILDGGNVGIGTTNAANNKVHIVGGSLSVNPTGAAEHHAVGGISIINGGSFASRAMQISPAAANTATYTIEAAKDASSNNLWWTYGVNTDNSFHINRGNDQIGGSDFVINSAGNVGIGATEPKAKLSVAGDLKVAVSDKTYVYTFSTAASSRSEPRCSCDTTETAADCASPFYTDIDSGATCNDWTGPASQQVYTRGSVTPVLYVNATAGSVSINGNVITPPCTGAWLWVPDFADYNDAPWTGQFSDDCDGVVGYYTCPLGVWRTCTDTFSSGTGWGYTYNIRTVHCQGSGYVWKCA